jgi:hypothetical protein
VRQVAVDPDGRRAQDVAVPGGDDVLQLGSEHLLDGLAPHVHPVHADIAHGVVGIGLGDRRPVAIGQVADIRALQVGDLLNRPQLVDLSFEFTKAIHHGRFADRSEAHCVPVLELTLVNQCEFLSGHRPA